LVGSSGQAEQERGAVRLLGRHDGEPPLARTVRRVGLHLEPEHVGVEALCLLLVVDEDARQLDKHLDSSVLDPASFLRRH
jgi:hypothetical protein